MNIDWNTTIAAVWRAKKQYLRPIQTLDPIQLRHLVNIDEQKRKVIDNTERFIGNLPANNILLWGARGCGKSALIKATLNAYQGKGLRGIEVDKYALLDLPDIVDDIRDLDFKFIIFCDDLTFNQQDDHYRALKSVLDGSFESTPDNVLIYATSNRRHLLPENSDDNNQVQAYGPELHYGDAIEEKISLADRFGLWISFYSITLNEYLAIVDKLFENYCGDKEQLHREARQFAMSKGSQNGRTAVQFYHSKVDQPQGKPIKN